MLLAAGGASWEALALRVLTDDGFAVVKRCVDLPDLLATAATGVAEIAVVSGDLVGLDVDALNQLLRAEVGTVAVGGPGERLLQIGRSGRDRAGRPRRAGADRAVGRSARGRGERSLRGIPTTSD